MGEKFTFSTEEELDLLEGRLMQIQRFLSGDPREEEFRDEVNLDYFVEGWSETYDMMLLELDPHTESYPWPGDTQRYKEILERHQMIHNKVEDDYGINIYRQVESRNDNMGENHLEEYDSDTKRFEDTEFRDTTIETPDYLTDI